MGPALKELCGLRINYDESGAGYVLVMKKAFSFLCEGGLLFRCWFGMMGRWPEYFKLISGTANSKECISVRHNEVGIF